MPEEMTPPQPGDEAQSPEPLTAGAEPPDAPPPPAQVETPPPEPAATAEPPARMRGALYALLFALAFV